MQPISLKLENFGPYENSLIDFSNYYAQSLFLITGKTGAGKTTIFDGMSYALYGSTSGGLRQGKEMRSNFASIGNKTKVTFIFKQAGKTYQIEREPEQLVKKLRGEGFREQTANVILTIFDEDQKEISQLTKQKDIGPFLSELIQLNEQQFSQIVMLPQGEFRRFLIADSDSKEKVLRKLFNTYFYQDVAEALRQKKKGIEISRKKDQQDLALLVSQINWHENFQEQLLEEMPLAEVLKIYQEQEQQDKEIEQQLTKELEDSKQALASQTDQIAIAKKQIEYFESYQDVLMQLEGLKELEETIIKDKEAIYLFKKVQKIEPIYNVLQTLLLEKQESLSKKELFEIQQKDVTQDQIQWNDKLKLLLDQEEDIKKKEKELADIELMIPLFEKQASIKASLTLLKENKQQEIEKQENISQKQENLDSELKLLNQLIARKPEYLEKQLVLETQVRQVQVLLDKVMTYEKTHEHLAQCKEDYLNSETELLKCEKRIDEVIDSLKHAKSEWAKAQITQLSLDLIDGEACLVCGSTKHPNPFHGDEVTKEDIESLKLTVEKVENELSKVKEDRMTIDNKQKFLVREKNQLEEAAFILENEINEELKIYKIQTDWQLNLEKQQTIIDTELKRILDLLSEIENKKELEQELQEKQQVLIEQLTQQNQQLRDIEKQEIQLTTSYDDLLSRLPNKNKTLDMLLVTKEELSTTILNWQDRVEKAQTKRNQSEKELLVLQTTIKNETENLIELEEKLSHNQEKINQFTVETTITEDKLKQAMSEIHNLEKLENNVRQFEQQQYALQKETEKWKELIKDKERPNLDPLLMKEQEYIEVITRVEESLQERRHFLVTNQQKIEEILAKEAGMSTELKKLEEITELANVMLGDSENKLSVERFVLQSYLKRILTRANEKLIVLTNGRYYFELKAESGSYKKKTGLEINIFDDNVGAIRSVNTLSGGESFIAALSLALSLAEVIQEESGGIKIDAMFIDEGFGSLDEDALEMAIRALESIEGDNRIIGIISHVRELKERIPQQLQVVSKNGKSSVIERLEFE